MKRFVANVVALFLGIVMTIATAMPSAAITLPPGVHPQLVLVSECRIDFNASIHWSGPSGWKGEYLALQVSALAEALGERNLECLDDYCVFTNIDWRYYTVLKPRFLENLQPEYRDSIVRMMSQCQIAVNVSQSLASTGGGSCSNTLQVNVVDSVDTSVSVTQRGGCNFARITIVNAVSISVFLDQFGGGNYADLIFGGSSYDYSLSQGGGEFHTESVN